MIYFICVHSENGRKEHIFLRYRFQANLSKPGVVHVYERIISACWMSESNLTVTKGSCRNPINFTFAIPPITQETPRSLAFHFQQPAASVAMPQFRPSWVIFFYVDIYLLAIKPFFVLRKYFENYKLQDESILQNLWACVIMYLEHIATQIADSGTKHEPMPSAPVSDLVWSSPHSVSHIYPSPKFTTIDDAAWNHY